jgi:hypothetical protein
MKMQRSGNTHENCEEDVQSNNDQRKDRLNYSQIITSLHPITPLWKKQVTNMYVCMCETYKYTSLVSRIYEEFLQIHKKKRISRKKWAKYLNKHSAEENKHMKRYSTTLVRIMQIKNTIRNRCLSSKIYNSDNMKIASKYVQKFKFSFIADRSAN